MTGALQTGHPARVFLGAVGGEAGAATEVVAGLGDVAVGVVGAAGRVLVAVETVSRSQIGHRAGPGGLPVQVYPQP